MSRGSERQRETENVRKGRTESDVRDLESWVTMRSWCLCESLYANTMCKAAARAGMDHRRTHPPESSRFFFALFPLPSFARGWGLLVRLSRSFGFLAPRNGHLFRRLQRLLFVKSCFQTAGCVLSVRNPKPSCGICFLSQEVRILLCLLMEWGFVVCMARQLFSKDRRLWVRKGFPNPHQQGFDMQGLLLRGKKKIVGNRLQQSP